MSGWSGQGRSGSVGGSSGSGSSFLADSHSSRRRPGKGSPPSTFLEPLEANAVHPARPGPSGPRAQPARAAVFGGGRWPFRGTPSHGLQAAGTRLPPDRLFATLGCVLGVVFLPAALWCFVSRSVDEPGLPPPGVLTSQEITVGLPPWKASCPCPCAVEERGNPGTASPMPRDQERNKRATKKTKQAVSPLSSVHGINEAARSWRRPHRHSTMHPTGRTGTLRHSTARRIA